MKIKKTQAKASLPSFPSMAACSGATGIPMALLRQAKRAGCPAFDQAGRVHLAPLLAWLFADENASTGLDWQSRFQRARALGLENRTAKERGELYDVSAWVAALQDTAGALRTRIFSTLEAAPLKLAAAGEDVPANREALSGVLWQVFADFGSSAVPAADALTAHTKAAMKTILDPKPKTSSTHEKETEVKK